MITWDRLGEPPHEVNKSYLCWCFFGYADKPVERAIVLTWRCWSEDDGHWEWDDNESRFWGNIICWSDIVPPEWRVIKEES